jgi:hypothetical protein
VWGLGEGEVYLGFLLLCVLVFALIGGGVGSAIGSSKGRATEGFWLGLFLGVIGWILVAVMEPSEEVAVQRNRELASTIAGVSHSAGAQRRPCPWCAEMILPAAVVCRYCGRDVEPVSVVAAPIPTPRVDHSNEYPHAARLYPMQFERAYEQMNALPAAPPDADAWLEFVCKLIQGGWDPAKAAERAERGPLW